MIPAAANIPLTICSVVIRRFIDSYTGRVPLAVAASIVPSTSTVALFSGALFCLYHQLRRGTLVNIGMGRRLTSMITNSRHTIQRRVNNSSWFLRNIAACRRNCTEAMLRIACQSNDSLQNIQAETGTIIETNSLPVFTRHTVIENLRNVNHMDEPPLEKLYSNKSFDSHDCSNQDLQNPKRKPRIPNSKRWRNNHTPNRPMTRNFKKCIPEDTCEDSRNRLSPKKRKKSEVTLDESEDQPFPIQSSSEVRKRQLRHLSDVIPQREIPSKLLTRKYSERIKKLPKTPKITRKTRSGRVYAYRL